MVAPGASHLNNADCCKQPEAQTAAGGAGEIAVKRGAETARNMMAENEEPVWRGSRREGAATVRQELATLITQALNLDVAPADIDPEAPLYGEGLGLDSIDILEIALVVSKQYGVELKADSEENHVIFSSLSALSEFVVAQRTK